MSNLDHGEVNYQNLQEIGNGGLEMQAHLYC